MNATVAAAGMSNTSAFTIGVIPLVTILPPVAVGLRNHVMSGPSVFARTLISPGLPVLWLQWVEAGRGFAIEPGVAWKRLVCLVALAAYSLWLWMWILLGRRLRASRWA